MVAQPPQIVRKADRAIVLQRRIACTMSPEINGYRARERGEVLLLKPEVAAVAPEPMYEKDRRSVSASRLVIDKRDPSRTAFIVFSLRSFAAPVLCGGRIVSSQRRRQFLLSRAADCRTVHFLVSTCLERHGGGRKSRAMRAQRHDARPRAPEIVLCA